jgi:hypothetical protein
VRCRLLDVHVLARLHGQNGDERVPVVGSCGGNAVHCRVLERLAKVLDELRRAACLLADLLCPLLPDRFIDIADVQDLDILAIGEHLQVSASLSADPYDGIAKLLRRAGTLRIILRKNELTAAERGRGGSEARMTEELAARKRHGEFSCMVAGRETRQSYNEFPASARRASSLSITCTLAALYTE